MKMHRHFAAYRLTKGLYCREVCRIHRMFRKVVRRMGFVCEQHPGLL